MELGRTGLVFTSRALWGAVVVFGLMGLGLVASAPAPGPEGSPYAGPSFTQFAAWVAIAAGFAAVVSFFSIVIGRNPTAHRLQGLSSLALIGAILGIAAVSGAVGMVVGGLFSLPGWFGLTMFWAAASPDASRGSQFNLFWDWFLQVTWVPGIAACACFAAAAFAGPWLLLKTDAEAWVAWGVPGGLLAVGTVLCALMDRALLLGWNAWGGHPPRPK